MFSDPKLTLEHFGSMLNDVQVQIFQKNGFGGAFLGVSWHPFVKYCPLSGQMNTCWDIQVIKVGFRGKVPICKIVMFGVI